jgi:hypothetical protein
MLDGVPLLVVTSSLLFLFLYIFARLQLDNVRANWKEMRCELAVIAIAHMVPDGKDPNVDPTDFAVENFQFCLTQLMDASISLAMAPIMGVFQGHIDATKPMTNSMNMLRSSAASLVEPLTSMFNVMWEKIMVGVYMITRIYQKMHSSFDRVFGIAVSTIFAGIGMYKAIENFINFVVLVILIIMAIILVMMIFAFFLVLPAMPIVATTLSVLSASVFAGAASGMVNAFCVFPGTLVETPDGWKAVEDLRPGDPLIEGSVEGVLQTTGRGARCVCIGGVRLSETHLVFDEMDSKWKPASEHSLAVPLHDSTEVLYCLNTTTRTWKVKGGEAYSFELLLRDWEEMPVNEENSIAWEKHIYSILNENKSMNLFKVFSSPGRGLLSSHTLVWEKSKGGVPICDIQIGDFVKDSFNSYTRVLGTYTDVAESPPYSGPNSAAWIWNSDIGLWIHTGKIATSSEALLTGMRQIITESGIFITDDEVYVRDFTEVGFEKISETYDFIQDLLSAF